MSVHLLLCCLVTGSITMGCGEDDRDGDEPAADSCTRTVQSAPQLSADVEEELTRICRQGARDGGEAVRDATERVCVRVIEESLPAGPAADAAKEACGAES